MRLELDLSADDWTDYADAPLGDLKRVGVVIPTEDVGIRQFVRLGVRTDDGKLVTVMTPWLIWRAANEALTRHLGEAAPEPAPDELPPVLATTQEAMTAHGKKWGLEASHPDGTDREAWQEDAEYSRDAATKAALSGELTWAHTLLEAVHAALAAEDQGELSQALAAVAGTAANWMDAIDGRTDG
ncbi:hypothetical protein [Nonomuraea angiospora]|uniref:hypothetical protein n=1 Tax=Nonomuraea angiospora TaxID=46172 RepID=UPI0029B22E11|nr:hypothetical protein [Nonomuraea angiospora]MDX3109687.1 hypothetical protein [Nonomuraea angiospora]